ncbi:hypothetical protein BDV95DRAFT_563666 [Massariosphaeria phaeospora]|uniref:Uncharacterized protein n=1 Tax=Massariosphaeria phaeospora TaxID=100035 RepID=A0A7C8MQU1_9PLEO|nr:hypothetical protein BDV95DRAFT_563666 [Massariosphaeria phaeospora]
MTSPLDDTKEWTFIQTPKPQPNMATSSVPEPSVEPPAQVPAQSPSQPPKSEPEPASAPTNTTESRPALNRALTIETLASDSESEFAQPSRPRPRNPPGRPYPHPNPHPQPTLPLIATLSSSTHLLTKVNTFDGIADVVFPGRSSVYLTTYPFTDRDIKKWTWLFAAGIEDTWIEKATGRGEPPAVYESGRGEWEYYDDPIDGAGGGGGGGNNNDWRYAEPPRRRRPARDVYVPGVDMAFVYLSRALDTAVVSEEAAARHKLRFLVVVQRRGGLGAKLVVVDSRRAAGIVVFYEALNGNSTVFVGAVGGKWVGGKRMKKMRTVEGVEELVGAKADGEEGVVGVVC